MKIKYGLLAVMFIFLLISFKSLKKAHYSQTNVVKPPVEQWLLFKDSLNNFSILFPQQPEYEENEIKSEFGFIKGKMYFVFRPDNDLNTYYNIMVARYEGVDKFDQEDRDMFFDIRRDGAVINLNGEVILEKKLFINGNEGRQYKILIKSNNTLVTMRCYLVIDKLYIFNVISPRDYADNNNIYKFFNSFNILSNL